NHSIALLEEERVNGALVRPTATGTLDSNAEGYPGSARFQRASCGILPHENALGKMPNTARKMRALPIFLSVPFSRDAKLGPDNCRTRSGTSAVAADIGAFTAGAHSCCRAAAKSSA